MNTSFFERFYNYFRQLAEQFYLQFKFMTIVDFIDIFVVSVFIYYLVTMVKGVKALQMLILFLLITLGSLFIDPDKFTLIVWLLRIMSYVLIAYFVLIFQPEFRAFLGKLNTLKFFQFFFKKELSKEELVITHMSEAILEMSARRIGALIVFEQEADVRNYIDNEVEIDAVISQELIVTIFALNTPLHDGAIVVQNNRIKCARGILPLSENAELPRDFGTRHRAALGITELTDAGVIVISEETKSISYASDGQFIARDMNKAELESVLYDLMIRERAKDMYEEDDA